MQSEAPESRRILVNYKQSLRLRKLMQENNKALPIALFMLAAGHFFAMIAILLPFSAMLVLLDWEIQIRTGAGLMVIFVGVYLMVNPRHPKFAH